jgi:hypothetical protein
VLLLVLLLRSLTWLLLLLLLRAHLHCCLEALSGASHSAPHG